MVLATEVLLIRTCDDLTMKLNAIVGKNRLHQIRVYVDKAKPHSVPRVLVRGGEGDSGLVRLKAKSFKELFGFHSVRKIALMESGGERWGG